MSRSKLGTRYRCFQCSCAFFDLGKSDPICPRCGSDQRKAPKRTALSRSKSSSKKSEIPNISGVATDGDIESDADGFETVELEESELLTTESVEVVEEE